MTSQQSDPANSGNRDHTFSDAPDAIMDTEHNALEAMSSPLGPRLRAAREARGLDVGTCAHTLRLPTRVLMQIEANAYEGIDYHVYLGSYLSKYARYLGIDENEVKAELERIKPSQPTLVATGGISHSRYLLENYARAATYVVLTAAIVVPTIWLGVRGTLDRDVSHLAPLDAAPVAQIDAPAPASTAANSMASASGAQASGPMATSPAATPAVQAAEPAQDQQPLMASMTPFPNLGGDSHAAQPAAPVASDAVGTGSHSISLSIPQASWVEVTTKDGSRLEYGLLPAGSAKTYHSDQPLEVRIGNASGAQVMLDGQPMALDAYRRSNVAHFRVEMHDGKAAPAGA